VIRLMAQQVEFCRPSTWLSSCG